MSTYNLYTGLLRSFDELNHGSNTVKSFTYDFTHPSYKTLINKYNLDFDVGEDSELDMSLNIMNWLAQHTFYKGESGNTFSKQNALDILAFAYGKNNSEFGINCLALGIVLAECLQAFNIYAKVVSMNPLSPYDLDNHIVVQVYIKEEKRWVMLDPTYNTYLKDSKGRVLSLLELRNAFANQEEIIFGHPFDKRIEIDVVSDELINYYAKNSFYYRSSPVQTFGSHERRNNYIEFIPEGFDVKKRTINHFKYLKKRIGNEDYFDSVIQEIEKESMLLGNCALLEEIISYQ